MKHLRLNSIYASSLASVVYAPRQYIVSSTSLQLVANARAISSFSNHKKHGVLRFTTLPSPGASFLNIVQQAHANTSSGFFAPSNIATKSSPGRDKLSIKHSVVGDSEHLPSYPVPELDKTLDRLKESISPFAMNSAELAEALRLIDLFSRHGGPKLDSLLRKKAELTRNWLTHDWWIDEVYLKSRQPLVINTNPATIYPKFPFQVNTQRQLLNVTAELISGIIDFKHALLQGYNPESNHTGSEHQLDNQTCYHQYTNLFGTTRFPGYEKDTIDMKTLAFAQENEPVNFIISYKGKFFDVHLNNVDDKSLRAETILSILDKIISIDLSNSQKQLDGLGVLTAQCRSKWYNSFKMLDEESIKAIKDSEFVVCIDNIASQNTEGACPENALLTSQHESEDFMAALGRQILHADLDNVGNRWFDKTLQLIIVADEKSERLIGAGINYEHCVAEGTVITRLLEYSYDKAVQAIQYSSKGSYFSPNAVQSVGIQGPSTFRQLQMYDSNYIDMLEGELKQAKSDFVALIGQMELSYLNYMQYGSNAIKSWRFSPDSWFQVSLSLAFFNLHQRLVPCYESASTRHYAYGRTETVRSLTPQVAEFCLDPKFESMQQAISSHKAYADAATRGNGIDRALLGYKLTFEELKNRKWEWGLPTNGSIFDTEQDSQINDIEINRLFREKELKVLSAFFNNELIKRSSKFSLSTSQVSSVYPKIYMTYGPIVPDGYGCSYNITGQEIAAAITANSNLSFSCDVDGFKKSLIRSLDCMQDIVEDKRQKSRS